MTTLMWLNLNGYHAKSNHQENEVSNEPKTKPTTLHQRA